MVSKEAKQEESSAQYSHARSRVLSDGNQAICGEGETTARDEIKTSTQKISIACHLKFAVVSQLRQHKHAT